MASFTGMFVNSWTGSIKSFYGVKKNEGEMQGQSEREEAHKGQNTSKSDCVVLLWTQILVSSF